MKSATHKKPSVDAGKKPAPEKVPKTAVVLIHGMGEQRPMATLWGFVDAIWSTDREMVDDYDSPIYAKPDTINDSVDLRRVTTRYWKGANPRRIDFFEYYWAHMMRGNTVRSTVSWIVGLFIRQPSSVPAGLRGVWAFGLVLLAVAAILFLAAALPDALAQELLSQNTILLLGIFSTVSGLAAAGWLAPIAGDAARYFSTYPDNVEARQKIISNGYSVIERLTRSGEYDRIIVVGHSLGTAIALDILHSAFARVTPDQWAQAHAPKGTSAGALAKLEKASSGLSSATSSSGVEFELALSDFRTAQREYASTLRDKWQSGNAPWLVSDFVSLGSPLSKANVLISHDEPAFKVLTDRRGVPTCPPKLEQKNPPRFSFAARAGALVPHYGAVFGPTTWTNIYFPSFAIIFGDIVSGAVSPLFGPGVRDCQMSRIGLRFRHLDYWSLPEEVPVPEWIVALRKAVNLRLKDELTLWDGSMNLPSPALVEADTPQPSLTEKKVH